MFFYICIAISQSSRWFKGVSNGSHVWTIVCSDQICIEDNQSDLIQYKIKYYVIFYCVFELPGWDVYFFVTMTLYPVTPSA